MEIADYPTSLSRQIRITYFGRPGPGDVPGAEYDRLANQLTLRSTDATGDAQ